MEDITVTAYRRGRWGRGGSGTGSAGGGGGGQGTGRGHGHGRGGGGGGGGGGAFVAPALLPELEQILVTATRAPKIGPPFLTLGLLIAGFVYELFQSAKSENKRARKSRALRRQRPSGDPEFITLSDSELSLPGDLAASLQGAPTIDLGLDALGVSFGHQDTSAGRNGSVEEIFVTGTSGTPVKPPNNRPTFVGGAFDWFRWILELPPQTEIPPMPIPGSITHDYTWDNPPDFQPPDILPLKDPKQLPKVFVVPNAPGILIDPRDNPWGSPDLEPILLPDVMPLVTTKPRPITTPVNKPNPRTRPSDRPLVGPFMDPYTSPGFKPNTRIKPKNRPATRPLTGPRGTPVPLNLTGPAVAPQVFLKPNTKTDNCECKGEKKKEKKKREPRKECRRGTYIQTKTGIIYHPKETFPCP